MLGHLEPGLEQSVPDFVRRRSGGTVDIGEQVHVLRRASDEAVGDPGEPTAEREPVPGSYAERHARDIPVEAGIGCAHAAGRS